MRLCVRTEDFRVDPELRQRSANRRRSRTTFAAVFGPKHVVDMISDSGHETDALGHTGDERRRRPRKITGSCQTSVDP